MSARGRARGVLLLAAGLLYAGASSARMTDIVLVELASWSSGKGVGGAEIAAWDAEGRRLYVTAPVTNTLQILDLADPSQPRLQGEVDLSAYGREVTSVAVSEGRVAVTVEAGTDPGSLVMLSPAGRLLQRWQVGAGPDSVAFSPNGRWLVVANEGEPSDDYMVDPEGSVTVVDLRTSVQLAPARTVRLDLSEEQRAGLRIYGPGASVAQDLEPEYVAFAPDSRSAWVSLQENNGLIEIDLDDAEIESVMPLGYRDPEGEDSRFDPSDRDGVIQLGLWPVRALFEPDGIATFRMGGRTLLVTANEGDFRDSRSFSEVSRVADLRLDPEAFPDAGSLQRPERLGRLRVSMVGADEDGDGDVDALYAAGTRSISVWSPGASEPLWDSGSAIEAAIARSYPASFNCGGDAPDCFDERSDDQGPEPEGLAVAEIEKRRFVFVGLERMGGVVVFEIEKPRQGRFVQYVNTRDFSAVPGTTDSGPEGVLYVPAEESPTGESLVILSNEISGSVTIFQVRRLGD